MAIAPVLKTGAAKAAYRFESCTLRSEGRDTRESLGSSVKSLESENPLFSVHSSQRRTAGHQMLDTRS